MRMDRLDLGLNPAPVALWPILGATGRPNFKFVCGLDGPMGSTYRSVRLLTMC
jgi:hypothetical protein